MVGSQGVKVEANIEAPGFAFWRKGPPIPLSPFVSSWRLWHLTSGDNTGAEPTALEDKTTEES